LRFYFIAKYFNQLTYFEDLALLVIYKRRAKEGMFTTEKKRKKKGEIHVRASNRELRTTRVTLFVRFLSPNISHVCGAA